MTKPFLLDTSLLLALAWPNHVHHGVARAWFAQNQSSGWGTCTLTQLGFVRVSSHPGMGQGVSTQQALAVLARIVAMAGHRYFAEVPGGLMDSGLNALRPSMLTHGMVTDIYLVGTASANGGVLATLDRGLARLHPGKVELVGG